MAQKIPLAHLLPENSENTDIQNEEKVCVFLKNKNELYVISCFI